LLDTLRMMKLLGSLLLLPVAFGRVQLLIDTDLGFDVDDAGALAVGHHLSSLGLADIIGVVHNTGFVKGIGGVDVIATFYNQTSREVGAYTGPWGGSGDAQNAQDSYTSMLESTYDSDIKTYNDVQSGIDAYRKALGAAEDNSVTVASIGELTNLRDVIDAIPDLFSSKVKEIIYMDGGYNFGCGDSAGSEWSPWLGSTEDCDGAAQIVVDAITSMGGIKQVFSLNGGDIYTGQRFNDGCGEGPVKDAYQKYTNNGSRPSWDLIAVYMAIMGYESMYSTMNSVSVAVDYYGFETYTPSADSNQYQVWIDSDKKGDVTKMLDDILCSAPCRGNDCGSYELKSMTNCWSGHGAEDLSDAGTMELSQCLNLCSGETECDGVVVMQAGNGDVNCYTKSNIQLGSCDSWVETDTWVKKKKDTLA